MMKFYDLCTTPEDNKEEIIEMAKKLGWDGIGIISDQKNIKKIKANGIDVVCAVEIKPKNAFDLKESVSKIRKKVELIIARGGNPEINRIIVGTPGVDILSKPFYNDKPGLDHVICKIARDNNVAIEFSFGELLHSYKFSRSDIFSKMMNNAKMVRKYKTPFVITSRAVSKWDLRSWSELVSFGKLLGFQPNEIKDAISDKIVKENRKRLSSKWIMPGVEIEK